MVGINQIQRGIAAYIDGEVSGKLQGFQRVIVSAGGGVIAAKLPDLLKSPKAAEILGATGIFDGENVDVDLLYTELKRALHQAGAVTVDIPMPFQSPLVMTINENDLHDLYNYIVQQK